MRSSSGKEKTSILGSNPISKKLFLFCRQSWSLVLDVFFFQAEDGIRDATVTGVQTCALPIYVHLGRPEHTAPVDLRRHPPGPAATRGQRGGVLRRPVHRGSGDDRGTAHRWGRHHPGVGRGAGGAGGRIGLTGTRPARPAAGADPEALRQGGRGGGAPRTVLGPQPVERTMRPGSRGTGPPAIRPAAPGPRGSPIRWGPPPSEGPARPVPAGDRATGPREARRRNGGRSRADAPAPARRSWPAASPPGAPGPCSRSEGAWPAR